MRGRGEGTVYKDVNGRWHGQLILPNGKRRSIYGKKQREVQDKIAQLRREVEAGMHGSATGDPTFREFALDWLSHHRRRTKTISGYRGIAKNHLDIVGDFLLVKLRPIDIQHHYTRKLQSLKPTTVQHIHSFFHVVLEDAVRMGMIPKNPAAYVEAPGLHPEEMLPLTEQEMRHFLHTIKDEHYEVFFVMALATGMREAELLGLRWADINWERSWVRCHATLHRVHGTYVLEEMKSRSSLRTLPLPKAAIESLRRYQRLQSDDQDKIGEAWQDKWGLIFTTDAGYPVHPQTMLKRFRRLLRVAELREETRIHDLRHTFATLLLERGVHIKAVSELLGHSSITITLATYGHVTQRMQDTAIQELNALIPVAQIGGYLE
jgi:integrase